MRHAATAAAPMDSAAALHAMARSYLATLRDGRSCTVSVPGRQLLLTQDKGVLYLSGELALAAPLDEAAFARLCALALAGSAHYRATLCYGGAGPLHLVRRLPFADSASLLRAIEEILNQMDVWQSLLEDAAPEDMAW